MASSRFHIFGKSHTHNHARTHYNTESLAFHPENEFRVERHSMCVCTSEYQRPQFSILFSFIFPFIGHIVKFIFIFFGCQERLLRQKCGFALVIIRTPACLAAHTLTHTSIHFRTHRCTGAVNMLISISFSHKHAHTRVHRKSEAIAVFLLSIPTSTTKNNLH